MNTYQAYQTLQVDSDASFDDIKYAYRKLALELHPDKNIQDKDGKKFKIVADAYHYLKKEHKQKNSELRNSSTSEWKYTQKKTKTEQNFGRKKPEWGAPPGGKTPEEDWGRFTKDFEKENPDFWNQYEKEFWKNYDGTIHGGERDTRFKKTQKSEPQIDLTAWVEPSLCIGCCSCETIAPEVFVVDKISKMNPKSHVYNEKGAGYNKIMNAAETCPTKAIYVEEKFSKKRLFPW